MRHRARRGLVALAAAVLLTSCHAPAGVSLGDPAVGPMDQRDGGKFCMVKESQSDFVLGIESLIDTGDHHLVLDSAGLEGASNLTASRAYVALFKPHQRVSLFGVFRGTRPHLVTQDEATVWADRQQLSGARVPPRSSGNEWNLLVFVHSPDPDADGSVKHLVVHYHSGRQHYVWTGNVQYVLAARKCHQPSS
jgi:hypothetical protein